ncbi:related to SLD5 - subunit of the GINS complex [Ustilago trichophora]|uniref:Related to SLD5 - subunit of the GINS complex n=1 Tax=Ustilago trichophora TaxID=86804 RepID=A0A5C3E4V3_9BASI|nr:related to SLD5 - subunit of the GINS complex [Ustilago trichophora]
MPLPRYSIDDGADADEETFEESYASHNVASTSRLPVNVSSLPPNAVDGSLPPSSSYAGGRSLSPSLSAFNDAPPSSLDIDALLRNTTSDSTSTTSSKPFPSAASTGWPYNPTSPIARLSPFEQLTLFMSSQKSSPELLPFPIASFEALVSQMEQQQGILDSLLHLSASSTTLDDQEDSGGVDEDEFLRLNLVQVDLERSKWLLKQIVRCRMDLLQKYAGFIQARAAERRKLNGTEGRFVAQYWQMKKDHFQSAVLCFLPEQLHDLNAGQPEETLSQQQDQQQANSSNNMVPGPDLDAPVFIHCLQDCGNITLPDAEKATLSKNSIHLFRYRSIRHLVYQGSIVLL